jgi:hypothetical protein
VDAWRAALLARLALVMTRSFSALGGRHPRRPRVDPPERLASAAYAVMDRAVFAAAIVWVSLNRSIRLVDSRPQEGKWLSDAVAMAGTGAVCDPVDWKSGSFVLEQTAARAVGRAARSAAG